MTQRDFGNFNRAINPGADLVTTQDGSVRIGGIDLAAFAKDSSGNVTGLVGPGGAVTPLQVRRPRTILKRMLDQVGVTYANSGTAATPTIETTTPFGTPALKLAIPSGNAYAEVQLHGNTLANFDDHVVWRVWIEDATKISQIQTFAGTAGYSRLWQRTYNIGNSNINLFNGEHFIAAGPTLAATTNTFVNGVDTFADTKLRIFYNGGGATVNVWIERLVVHGNESPTVVFTLDDCVLSHYTRAFPELRGAGIVGAFGINSGDIGGNPALYMSAAQIAEMAIAGQEIFSHNVVNTQYPTQNAATYTAAFRTGLNALLAITPLASSVFHPWVQGGTGVDVQATMLAQGAQIMRIISTANNGVMNFFGDGVGDRNVSVAANGTHVRTLDSLIADVENCIRYGGTMFFMTHEIVDTSTPAANETSLSVWNGLVQYVAAARSRGLIVPSLLELYSRWISSGYLTQ